MARSCGALVTVADSTFDAFGPGWRRCIAVGVNGDYS
jgi:hypothetical protein